MIFNNQSSNINIGINISSGYKHYSSYIKILDGYLEAKIAKKLSSNSPSKIHIIITFRMPHSQDKKLMPFFKIFPTMKGVSTKVRPDRIISENNGGRAVWPPEQLH